MLGSLLCAITRLSRPNSARMAAVFLLIGYAVSFSLCSAQSSAQFNVKDNGGAPVSGAVVMVQPLGGVNVASRLVRRDIAVDQVDREFVPKLSIAVLGARLSFPNRDVVQHSVYSFSKAKSFEIPIYAGESPQVLTLDKAGVITLGCNIHDWMVGYIVVADTPIAELTKADGTLTVTDLPRGKYSLRVWHPQLRSGDFTQPFELGDTELRVDVKLELTPQRTRYKPPLKIKSY
jgi:plastocyanin